METGWVVNISGQIEEQRRQNTVKTGTSPENNIAEYFEQYLNKESIFQNKQTLQSNHIPKNLLHRDEQISGVSKIMAPALRKERPSNLFVYGKTGTGKTVCIKAITEQMEAVARTQGIPITIYYLNCKLKKVADTEYRLIAQLARLFNKTIPVTGLPTDEVYNILFNTIDEEEQLVIFVLDEIDHLVKKAGDELIYNLTRINTELKKSQVSIIGISNDLAFANNIDPRVKSSLSEEEMIFPPYNALQLQSILQERANLAFKPNVLEQGVIQKCAAYAAREHGDARRALELLRVAGELTDRAEETIVTMKHIDRAEEKIEHERFVDVVKTQAKQYKAVLMSIFSNAKSTNKNIFTGDIYNQYITVCEHASLRPLTQRRVSDIIADLDMQGLINAKVISKGRFGRTREVSLALPQNIIPEIEKILATELGL